MSRVRKSVTPSLALRRKSDVIMRFNEFAATPDSDSFLELDKALTGSRAEYGSVELGLDEKLAILQSIKSSSSFRFSHGLSFDDFVDLFATISKDQDAINHIKSQLSLLDLSQDKRANAIILNQAIDEFFSGRDSKLNLSEKCQFLASNCKDSESLPGAIAEYRQQMMQITAQKEVIIENTLTIFANEITSSASTKLGDGFRIQDGCVTKNNTHAGGFIRSLTNQDRGLVLAQALHLSLAESAEPLNSHDQLEVAQAVLDRYCANYRIEEAVVHIPPPNEFEEGMVAFHYDEKISEYGISGVTGHNLELQRKIENAKKSKKNINDRLLVSFFGYPQDSFTDRKIKIDGRDLIVSQGENFLTVKGQGDAFIAEAQVNPDIHGGCLMRIELLEKKLRTERFDSRSLGATIKKLNIKENGQQLVDQVLGAIFLAGRVAELLSRSRSVPSPPRNSPSLTAASFASRLSRLFKSRRGGAGSAPAR